MIDFQSCHHHCVQPALSVAQQAPAVSLPDNTAGENVLGVCEARKYYNIVFMSGSVWPSVRKILKLKHKRVQSLRLNCPYSLDLFPIMRNTHQE